MVAFGVSPGGLYLVDVICWAWGDGWAWGGWMVGFPDGRDLTIFFYFSYVYFQT